MDSSYITLGLTPGQCTTADVLMAYRKLAVLNHPDKVGRDSEAKMKAINAARDDIFDDRKLQTPIVETTNRQTYDQDGPDYTDEDDDDNPRPATPRKHQEHEATGPEIYADIDIADDYVHVERPDLEADANAKIQPTEPLADSFTDQDMYWSTSGEFFEKMSERLSEMYPGRLNHLHQRLNDLDRFARHQGPSAFVLWQRLSIQYRELIRVLHLDCRHRGPTKKFCNLLAEMLMTVRQLYTLSGSDLNDACTLDEACDLPFMLNFTGIQIHKVKDTSSTRGLTKMMSELFSGKRSAGIEDSDNRDLSFLESWLRECYPIIEKRWQTEMQEWDVKVFWKFAGYDRDGS